MSCPFTTFRSIKPRCRPDALKISVNENLKSLNTTEAEVYNSLLLTQESRGEN